MGLKTIPFRDIEQQSDNMYEAVVAMSGQAKEELNDWEWRNIEYGGLRQIWTADLKDMNLPL